MRYFHTVSFGMVSSFPLNIAEFRNFIIISVSKKEKYSWENP